MSIERRSSADSITLAAFSPSLDALEQLGLGEVVRVTRARVDGEAALGQPGERADQVGGHAGDQARAQQDRVDVPVGVVVGEDRAADVVLVAGRLEVARGGEDRVDRVVRVLAPVLVGVDPVHLPGGRHELHPADGAGGRDVQVAAVVGLDLVDRREDLPADAVLDAGGLVDRQQEERDAELADDEVGDAVGGRGAGQGVEEAGVARRWACRRRCAASFFSGLSFLPNPHPSLEACWQ